MVRIRHWGVDVRILEGIIGSHVVRVWSGCNRLRTGSSGELCEQGEERWVSLKAENFFIESLFHNARRALSSVSV